MKMLSCLKVMNKWFTRHKLPEISIRAGVHTGEVLVGNMGFESRQKYGVVGEEAEVPARLEELNKTFKSELLISSATHARLPEHTFVMRPVDIVYISTNAGPQVVYQVLERDKGRDDQADLR